MSNFASANAALRNALEAGFTALPIVYPNSPTDPTLAVASAGFVYCENRLEDERQITLGTVGTRTHRDSGVFTVWVCAPLGSKVGAAEAHVENIRALFGTTAIAGVVVSRRWIDQGQQWDGPLGRVWATALHVHYWTDRTE